MRLLFIVLFTFSGLISYAQPINIQFNNYSLEDGLSQSTVYTFLKDDLGYIWIGTRDGLNRFDAHSFKKYYPDSSPTSLSHRSVRTLVQDQDGIIWVGTDGGGIDRFNPEKEEFTNLCSIIGKRVCNPEWSILSMQYHQGKLYFSTRESGVFSYDINQQKLEHIYVTQSPVWDVLVTPTQVIIGSEQGVIIQQAGKSEPFLNRIRVTSLALHNDQLLVGSSSQGIFILEKNGSQFKAFDRQLSNISIRDITIDKQNRIWIATERSGIFLYNDKRVLFSTLRAKIEDPKSISENSIRTVYSDNEGVVWVGSNTSGFGNFHPLRYQFQHYTTSNQEGLKGKVILSFEEFDEESMLIGTEDAGLYRWNMKEGKFYQIPGFNNSPIVVIKKSASGTLWIGTDGDGLYRIPDIDKLQAKLRIRGLSDDSILSLYETSRGELIVGTYIGVNTIIGDKVIQSLPNRFNTKDRSNTQRVLALHGSRNGDLLMGTYLHGLQVFTEDGEVIELNNDEDEDHHILSNRVLSITECMHGNYWVGTYNGLYKLDTSYKVIDSFFTQNGLPSNVIYGMLIHNEKDIWLSTNFGLSAFSHSENKFLNYGLSDGIQSTEFNGGAYFKSKAGTMYFGGVNGFNAFDPSQVYDAPTSGNTVINGIQIEGVEYLKEVNDGELRLKPQQNFVTINFTYLNYFDPERQQFQYRLRGVSDNWIDIGNTRSVNFSGLNPNHYQFQIRASYTGEDWSVPSEVVAFSIVAPFWKRWYVLTMIAILSVLVVYGLMRYRLFYLLKEEKTRSRIARDLHDDLSATLSSISFFTEAAKRTKGRADSGKFLKLINKSAIEAKEKINDIIWAISPENDDWNSLLTKFKRYASDILEVSDIEYSIELNQVPEGRPTLEVKSQLWNVYKEIIANTIRHSSATKIDISISLKGNYLLVYISDNGVGFDPMKMHEGHGLNNIKQRLEQIDAEYKLQTQINEGVSYQLKIPIK